MANIWHTQSTKNNQQESGSKWASPGQFVAPEETKAVNVLKREKQKQILAQVHRENDAYIAKAEAERSKILNSPLYKVRQAGENALRVGGDVFDIPGRVVKTGRNLLYPNDPKYYYDDDPIQQILNPQGLSQVDIKRQNATISSAKPQSIIDKIRNAWNASHNQRIEPNEVNGKPKGILDNIPEMITDPGNFIPAGIIRGGVKIVRGIKATKNPAIRSTIRNTRLSDIIENASKDTPDAVRAVEDVTRTAEKPGNINEVIDTALGKKKTAKDIVSENVAQEVKAGGAARNPLVSPEIKVGVDGVDDLQGIRNANPVLFREATKAGSAEEFIQKMSKGKPETVDSQVLTDFYNKVNTTPSQSTEVTQVMQPIDSAIFNTPETGQMFEELANAQAGQRFATPDGVNMGMKSSFPDWVPEDLRSRKMFDRVQNILLEGKVPTGKNKKETELFNVIKEEIMVRNLRPLTSVDNDEIIQLRLENRMKPETYLDNSPERNAKRIQWADDLYNKGVENAIKRSGAVKQEKQMYVVIGPPGAGKSSVFVNPIVSEHGAIVIDSDLVKEMVDEFGGGKFARAVHKESDGVAAYALENAINKGDNIVYPIVGKNTDKVEELVKYFNERGYDVHLKFNDLPPEEAAKRVVTRFNEPDENGIRRFVDPNYVLNIVGLTPKRTYDKLKSLYSDDLKGAIKSYEAYSNDVPFGEKPRFLESSPNTPTDRGIFKNERSGQPGIHSGGSAETTIRTPEGQAKPEIIAQDIVPESPTPKPGKPAPDTSGDMGLNDLKISNKETKAPIKGRVSDFVEKVKTDYLNRFTPIEDLAKGKNLKPSENPAVLLKRYSGGMGIANERIDNELSPILNKTKNLEGLRQFLVAKRSNELADRGLSKRADKALQELKDSMGPTEYKNFENIADELYAYQKKNLQQLLDVGVLSQKQFNDITSKNQKYIPFNRVMDNLEGAGYFTSNKNINVKSSGIKAIKGSDRDIVDPLESVVGNTYEITKTVEKQRVLSAMVGLGEFKKLKTPMALINVDDEVVGAIKTGYEPKQPHITLFQDGKKVYYETSKEVADIIGGMNEENLNVAVRIMSVPARIMRAGATGLNVGFAVPNIVRDQLSAAVNSKYGGIPIYDFISGLSSVIKKDKMFQSWVKSGADQASFFSQDRTTLQKGLKDITGGLGHKAGKFVKNPLEMFRIMGEFSEKGSRVGVYKRAMKGASKEGLTGFDQELAAMEQAREATIDFARRGSKMKAMNSIIPFLNARMQGSLKLIDSARKRPVQTLAIGGAIAGAPALALYAHNSRFPEYDEIPSYIKNTNFIIMTGNKDVPFIKIPKGEIGQIFGNPIESFLDYVRGKEGDGFADTMINIMSNFSPLNGPGDLIPTAFKGPLEVAANYDTFRDQNIVSQYKKDLPPEQQYDSTTSETAKAIGKVVKYSPAKIEHLFKGYTAGVGKQALQLSDAIGFGKKPKTSDLPVIDRFMGEKKDLSKTANDVYNMIDKANTATAKRNNDIKDILRKGGTPDYTGLSKQQISSLKNTVEDEKKKGELSPTQKALYSLSEAKLKIMLQQNPDLRDDINKVIELKKRK